MFHDPVAEARFAELQKQFGFNTLIETGTHLGHGALNASKYCNTVITAEVNWVYHLKAILEWREKGYQIEVRNDAVIATRLDRRIFAYLDSSPKVLDRILPTIKDEIVCFYLDAHWGAYWPLQDELKAIAFHLTFRKCVIIIHDFKVPGKDFGYDNHGGQDLDFPYVENGLRAINPRFLFMYNERAEGNKRGILYALPT